MIKKNTKIIFEDGDSTTTEELKGGMPLSKGEIIHLHRDEGTVDYQVVEKIIDYHNQGEDKIVNITYTLKKK